MNRILFRSYMKWNTSKTMIFIVISRQIRLRGYVMENNKYEEIIDRMDNDASFRSLVEYLNEQDVKSVDAILALLEVLSNGKKKN